MREGEEEGGSCRRLVGVGKLGRIFGRLAIVLFGCPG